MGIINPYVHLSENTGYRKEIDLRDHMDRILFGDDITMPHGQIFIIRHMRKDSKNHLIPCPTCNTGVTHEGTKNYKCSYCAGEGNLWDDSFQIGYQSDETPSMRYTGKLETIGEFNSGLPFIFFRYDTVIDLQDKIIEPLLTTEGEVTSPVVINRTYKIPWLRELRSDNGRIEYIKVRVVEST